MISFFNLTDFPKYLIFLDWSIKGKERVTFSLEKQHPIMILLFQDNAMEYGQTVSITVENQITRIKRGAGGFSDSQYFSTCQKGYHAPAGYLNANDHPSVCDVFEEAYRIIR
jgi:hypothetical protein